MVSIYVVPGKAQEREGEVASGLIQNIVVGAYTIQELQKTV